jgi:hypothetical protein
LLDVRLTGEILFEANSGRLPIDFVVTRAGRKLARECWNYRRHIQDNDPASGTICTSSTLLEQIPVAVQGRNGAEPFSVRENGVDT